MKAIYLDKDIPKALLVKVLKPIWHNVVWSPLSPIQVVEVPEPDLPAGRWVRVQNRQCGICASDLSLLFLKPDPAAAPVALPGNERIYLGHEVVGEVVEVGPEVTRFAVGDRVVMESRFMGANCLTQEIDPPCPYCARGDTRLCENASLGRGPRGEGGGWGTGYTAHEDELWPVPDDLDDDQASLIEPMSVALHGVLRHPPAADDHVLVIGAGIIGLLTVQAVKIVSPSCHLTVMARYPHQIEAARRLGADEIIRGGNLYEEVAGATDAKYYTSMMNRGMLLGGFEVIYDCIGSANTVYDGLRWTRAGGAFVLVGITFGELKVDLNPVWYQEVDLIGSNTFGMETWNGRQVHTFDLVIEMLQEKVLKHEGLITHRFPFESYRQAIDTATDKRTGAIKVTFVYPGDERPQDES